MLIGGTRDGRSLARQIMEQYPTTAQLATALSAYEPLADMVNYPTLTQLGTILEGYQPSGDYVTQTALDSILEAFVTSAQLTTELAAYVTTTALGGVLAAYTTTASLTVLLANYALTSALSAYVTTAALAATLASYATQAWVQARTWINTQLTNASGIATFATVAGQFSTAPLFILSVQTGAGAAGVYNVQQNGPAVQSGSPGAYVYTVQAKVSLSLAVTILAISVLGVQAAPANVPVICMAHV